MFEPSHRETQTRWPDPLAGTGLLNIGTWALPAMALSVASALVFFVVVLFLQHDREIRSLFILPRSASLPLAAVSAALAWIVVLRCRHRPGRPQPRFWALMLAGLNSLIAIGALVFPKSSLANALVVAGLAAAFTLLPRLARLPPDSGMVPLVAPLAFVGVLILVLPAVWVTGGAITQKNRSRVDEVIRQLQLWTTEVREVSGYEWSQIEEAPDMAAQAVKRLEPIQVGELLSDEELWQQAAILRRDSDLATAGKGLVDAVVAGFSPERVPKVSSLEEPAVYWDTYDQRWEASLAFPKASEVVGRYHQELGRIFAELDGDAVPAGRPGAVELKQHCSARKGELRNALQTQMESWADNWAVFRVPDHGELLGRSEVSLVDLLQISVLSPGLPPLRPADLPQLLSLPLRTARQWGLGAPGCRALEYEHKGSDYYRLDCYSYAPRSGGLGADLRVEMRLVYRLDGSSATGPAEVFFLFPVPATTESESLDEALMADLANAVRKATGVEIQRKDLGGSVTTGFGVVQNGRAVQVLKPAMRKLLGDQNAWEIRALRGSGGDFSGGRAR